MMSMPKNTWSAAGRAVLATAVAWAVGLTMFPPPPARAAEHETPAQGAEGIETLIENLGHREFKVRQAAQKKLIEIGAPAATALQKVLDADIAEVRYRARKILSVIRRNILEENSRAIREGILWKFPVEGGVAGSPAVSNGVVYFAGLDGKLYAVNAGTGKVKWRLADLSGSAAASATPLVIGETVFVSARAGGLYALDAETGRRKWQRKLHGPASALDGVVYLAGGTDGTGGVWALDAETGKEKWRLRDRLRGACGRPAAAGGTVYVGSSNGEIHALDAKTGRERWTFQDSKGRAHGLALHKGKLYFRTGEGLYALDTDTGKEAWRLAALWGNAVAAPQVAVWGAAAGGAAIRGIVSVGDLQWHDMPLVIGEGVIHLVSGGRLVAVDCRTGKEKWACKPPLKNAYGQDQVIVVPACAGQFRAPRLVIVMGPGGQPRLIRGDGGTIPQISAPAMAEGVICFGSAEGLHALDLATRRPIWMLGTAAPVSGRPIIADGIIYFGTARNAFWASAGRTMKVQRPKAVATAGSRKDYLYALRLALPAGGRN